MKEERMNDRFQLVDANQIEHNLIHLKQLVFEVTDACNLRCKYCGYADFYQGYDERINKMLPFKKVQLIIDYLHDLWRKSYVKGTSFPISISFYGGEPLLNVPLIKQIISYLESLDFVGKKYFYNMTTNAMLLDKYMDFIVEKDIRLLISLDGDEEGQSYRVDHTGRNSFSRVIHNIKLLQEKYPDYFDKLVQFNAVLHNRNSVEATYRFIKDNFNKSPRIAPLNNSGIKDDKKKEFINTYKNVSESLKQAHNCEALEAEMFISAPDIHQLANYIFFETNNVYNTYNELFLDKNKLTVFPTGTCTPFSKKMFITVNGKIIPCERIDHDFAVGFIHDEYIDLNYEYVADRHNHFVQKYNKQCSVCALYKNCMQCVYQIDDIRTNETKCLSFCPMKSWTHNATKQLIYLRKHPGAYQRILNEVSIRS